MQKVSSTMQTGAGWIWKPSSRLKKNGTRLLYLPLLLLLTPEETRKERKGKERKKRLPLEKHPSFPTWRAIGNTVKVHSCQQAVVSWVITLTLDLTHTLCTSESWYMDVSIHKLSTKQMYSVLSMPDTAHTRRGNIIYVQTTHTNTEHATADLKRLTTLEVRFALFSALFSAITSLSTRLSLCVRLPSVSFIPSNLRSLCLWYATTVFLISSKEFWRYRIS